MLKVTFRSGVNVAVLCAAASLLCAAPSTAGFPPPFTQLPPGDHLRFHVYRATQISKHQITGISCPKTAWCMAVDEAGDIIHYSDGTWSPPRQVDRGSKANGDAGDGSWYGVSCPSTSWCMAVSYEDGYSIYKNGSWSTPTITGGDGAGTGVSCTSSKFCAVAELHEGASFYDSGHWTNTENDLSGLQGSTPISCAGGTTYPVFCMEVDNDGDYSTTTDDVHWSHPHLIDHQAGVDSAAVSCLGKSFCVAGFQRDNRAAGWNGTSWTAASTWATSNHDGTPAVSCTSQQNCAVIDGDGSAQYGVGGIGWDGGQIFDTSGPPPTAASCATLALVCQVGDADGFVYQISWADSVNG